MNRVAFCVPHTSSVIYALLNEVNPQWGEAGTKKSTEKSLNVFAFSLLLTFQFFGLSAFRTCRGFKSHVTLLSFISRGESEFDRVKIRTRIMQYFAPCQWAFSGSSGSWIQPFSRAVLSILRGRQGMSQPDRGWITWVNTLKVLTRLEEDSEGKTLG